MRKLIVTLALSLPLFAQSSSAVAGAQNPVITVTKRGALYVDEKPTNINNLVAVVRQSGGAKDVYLRADPEAPWDSVTQVLAALSATREQMHVRIIGKERSQTELLLPNIGSSNPTKK